MIFTKNKNINILLKNVYDHLAKRNIRVKAVNQPFIIDSDDEGLMYGYFSETTKILSFAYKNPQKIWVPVVIHEYNHFLQWVDVNSIYHKTYNNQDPSNIMINWINTGNENIDDVINCVNIIRDIELDCERKTVKMMIQNNLYFNIVDYCRDAVCCLYLYNMIPLLGRWPTKDSFETSIKDFKKRLPKNLDGDFKTTPKFVKNFFLSSK